MASVNNGCWSTEEATDCGVDVALMRCGLIDQICAREGPGPFHTQLSSWVTKSLNEILCIKIWILIVSEDH